MEKYRIQKSRQAGNYVTRNSKRISIRKVNPVNAAEKTHHSTQNESFGYQSDMFYNHLENFKEKYRAFFKALENYNRVTSASIEENLIEHIVNWCQIYNNLVKVIIDIDNTQKTQYYLRIESFWLQYGERITRFGFYFDNLYINYDLFILKEHIKKRDELLEEAFKPKARWMLKLFEEFLYIKTAIQTQRQKIKARESGKGLLIDTKT